MIRFFSLLLIVPNTPEPRVSLSGAVPFPVKGCFLLRVGLPAHCDIFSRSFLGPLSSLLGEAPAPLPDPFPCSLCVLFRCLVEELKTDFFPTPLYFARCSRLTRLGEGQPSKLPLSRPAALRSSDSPSVSSSFGESRGLPVGMFPLLSLGAFFLPNFRSTGAPALSFAPGLSL